MDRRTHLAIASAKVQRIEAILASRVDLQFTARSGSKHESGTEEERRGEEQHPRNRGGLGRILPCSQCRVESGRERIWRGLTYIESLTG
jgi:hypothetical protein